MLIRFATCALILLGASAASGAGIQLGIFPLAGANDSVVEAALLEAVQETSGFDPVGPLIMREHVEAAAELGISCTDTSPTCLARIAATSGMSTVMSAELRTASPNDLLALTLIDVGGQGEPRRRDVALHPDPAERAAGVKAGVRALLQQTDLIGGVRLAEFEEGERLFVDGRPAARADLDRLSVGSHTVRVEGATVREVTIDVLAGVVTDIKLPEVAPSSSGATAESPDGPMSAAESTESGLNGLQLGLWAGAGAVGGGGVLLGTALIVGAIVAVPERKPGTGQTAAQWEGWRTTGLIVLAGGVLVVVGSAAVASVLGVVGAFASDSE